MLFALRDQPAGSVTQAGVTNMPAQPGEGLPIVVVEDSNQVLHDCSCLYIHTCKYIQSSQ
ncbi:hypothetical protein PSP6_270187 [Paraburkholderia tropica]|nr:hypothetical protein PSP6_270187 [Paraburkholderia tropica]